MKNLNAKFVILLTVVSIFANANVLADVKKGVDAWAKGDYQTAVKEWQDPALNGDADAQFNLGQAYASGRGVEANTQKAEVWYALAAKQGHLKAINNYGLMLFKQDKRMEAMPFLDRSALRGEPRAQYIMGTAYFNGELVNKDYIKAYAFMSLASTAGLVQANKSLQSMNDFLPEEERQKALDMANAMKSEFRW